MTTHLKEEPGTDRRRPARSPRETLTARKATHTHRQAGWTLTNTCAVGDHATHHDKCYREDCRHDWSPEPRRNGTCAED